MYITIPADVPGHAQQKFIANYNAITNEHGNFFLFAADHKLEHLNADFYGKGIDISVNNPEHLFNVAESNELGAFATSAGLIMRYGKQYPTIRYIAKLNGKTDCIPTEQSDPLSKQLWEVQDVVDAMHTAKLRLCGIGFTIYLGSEFEQAMLKEAAHVIYQAHQHGLITTLWIYPRGKAVSNKKEFDLLTGAAGVANALGADFVKLSFTTTSLEEQAAILKVATQAAGNTEVICAGGAIKDKDVLINTIQNQLAHGARGCAVGRNIFQHAEQDAYEIIRAIAHIL